MHDVCMLRAEERSSHIMSNKRQAEIVPEADPQRTLAEAAAAEPADAVTINRIPSDAATVGSEIAPAAAPQGLEPRGAEAEAELAPADEPIVGPTPNDIPL